MAVRLPRRHLADRERRGRVERRIRYCCSDLDNRCDRRRRGQLWFSLLQRRFFLLQRRFTPSLQVTSDGRLTPGKLAARRADVCPPMAGNASQSATPSAPTADVQQRRGATTSGEPAALAAGRSQRVRVSAFAREFLRSGCGFPSTIWPKCGRAARAPAACPYVCCELSTLAASLYGVCSLLRQCRRC